MKRILTVMLLLFISNNLVSQSYWKRVTDSIPNFTIVTIQFTSANKGFACGGYRNYSNGAFFRTTNGGSNWMVTQFPHYSPVDCSFIDDNTGYIAGWKGMGEGSYILKTTNGGETWNITDSIHSSFFKIKFYDNNTGMIVSKYNSYHKTTDGGISWVTTYNNALWMEPNTLICLNADTWLVADDAGHAINKTINGGINWAYLDFTNIGMSPASLYFINDTIGFSLDYDGKIFKSTNAGNNWFKIDSIPNVNFLWSEIKFANEKTGYIANGSGTYKTTNGGYNWNLQVLNNRLGFYSLYLLNADTVFVGGNNGFIYKTTTGGEVYNPVRIVPDNYSLSQNYPNPFNPVTTIKYQVPRAGIVKIEVFDIAGRRIQTLVNNNLQPDFYEVTFNGSSHASGVYFYRLQSGDFVQTKRMVLIK